MKNSKKVLSLSVTTEEKLLVISNTTKIFKKKKDERKPVKVIHEKVTTNIRFNRKIVKGFPLRSKDAKRRMWLEC